jgi:hypothetical protein
LVMLTAVYGPLDLKKLEGIFQIRNPDDVEIWIKEFQAELKEIRRKLPSITLEMLIQALEEIGFEGPNSTHVTVVADSIRRMTNGVLRPTKNDIFNLISGLQVIVPNILRLSKNQDVILSVSPKKLLEAIKRQIENIPEDYKSEIESIWGVN